VSIGSSRGVTVKGAAFRAAFQGLSIHERPSPHFDERPKGTKIDTVVIHCMYLPKAPQPLDAESCVQALRKERVSAHYLISRRGKIIQLVTPEKRAWHAGVSKMPFSNDTRENVNHFSIGIELVGMPTGLFTTLQYQSLTGLLRALCKAYPVRAIVGHDAIAPGRKVDPGEALDWALVRRQLGNSASKGVRFFQGPAQFSVG